MMTHREDIILKYVKRNKPGLEIGPSINPIAPKRAGFLVETVDYLSATEIARRHKSNNPNAETELIEEVDYLWRGERLPNLIAKKNYYQWIIASHVIEHIPDVISFLQDAYTLLTDNGVLALAIPDKRYHFDAFNPIDSTGRFIDAHYSRAKKASPGKIFDALTNCIQKNGKKGWDKNESGDITFTENFQEAIIEWKEAVAQKKYYDCHQWRFTPESFYLLIKDLHEVGILKNFEITEISDAIGHEFFVFLRKIKTKPAFPIERDVLLKKINRINNIKIFPEFIDVPFDRDYYIQKINQLLNFVNKKQDTESITGEIKTKQQKRIKIGILTNQSLLSSSFLLRIYWPIKLLSQYLEKKFIYTKEDVKDCDIVVFQRESIKIDIANEALSLEKPIIYETDDLLIKIPSNHPFFRNYAGSIPLITEFLLKVKPVIIASTLTLGENLKCLFGNNCFVFRNYLNRTIIPETNKRDKLQTDKPIRLGFAGTISHAPDLALIEPALLRLAHRYGDRIEIFLWGAWTENLRACDRVQIIKQGLPYWHYLQRLNDLEFDIGLIPLADTEFNRCKSDIKWVEYGALGIPAVVSDLPLYEEAKRSGLAVVVPNDSDAWYEALVDLIEQPEKRLRLAQAVRAYVWEHRTIEHHIHEYAAILNQVLPPHLRLPEGEALELTPITAPTEEALTIPEDDYTAWRKRRSLQEADAEVLAERMMRWPRQPLITLITFARQTDFSLLANTSASLQQQLYPHWRWIVVSDQPAPDPVFETAEFLGWLQVATLEAPEAVAEVINALLPDFCGEFFAVLPPGFQLEPQALLLIADGFMHNPEFAAVYCDHDHYETTGERTTPHFKPDFDADLFYGNDYIGAALWFRTAAVQVVGGARPYPGAERYELLLRLFEQPNTCIGHVGEPLVSLPVAAAPAENGSRALARRTALEDHLKRLGIAATITAGPLPGAWLVERDGPLPKASVIVPIGDVFHLAAALLDSLLRHTDYPDWELIVVDHATTDPDIAALLAESKARYPNLKVVRDEGPYALGRLYGVGAVAAEGEVLTFLHQDCEVREPFWLKRLVREALRPEVGVVGPLVVRPEFAEIDSVGIWLGGAAAPWSSHRPAFHGSNLSQAGYLSQIKLPHQVSAVSSVGLTTRRALFAELGGFDATYQASGFELDYCLRVRAAGKRVLVTPLARLIHHGKAVLPYLLTAPLAQLTHAEQKECDDQQLFARWGERLALDPFSSPHFDYGAWQPKIDLLFPLSWQRHHTERHKVLGFPVQGGSGQYRVCQPLRALIQAGWLQAESIPEEVPRLPTVSELLKLKPDTVLLHQRLGPQIETQVAAWRKAYPELRVVFGMDDRLDAVPKKSSVFELARRAHRDARAKLRRLLALADAAVVSTAPLAELLDELRPQLPIYVIPNALARHEWEPHYRPRPIRDGRPRVGWVGAMQHRGDLELLIPVIEATRDEVDWVFMGMWLPEFEKLVTEKHPWVDFEAYPKHLALLDLDLALAPLEANEFNQAKSNLRLLEYGAFAYPVICSDLTPYRENDPPVTRLPNDPALWIEAIRAKLTNREALRQEGEALRQWVFNHYLLEHTLPAWNMALLGSGDGQ